mmetsp:Transcript_19078/g.35000  ORF Transcript_19078/g.35000 Transcript_19078/m.35000 type:complete len:84 (+) Transcript_19078:123-374(+)
MWLRYRDVPLHGLAQFVRQFTSAILNFHVCTVARKHHQALRASWSWSIKNKSDQSKFLLGGPLAAHLTDHRPASKNRFLLGKQ